MGNLKLQIEGHKKTKEKGMRRWKFNLRIPWVWLVILTAAFTRAPEVVWPLLQLSLIHI